MASNRTAGAAQVTVGLLWLAAMPAFLWFMVFMEGRAEPARPDSAAWRLWRALEELLIEPRWLAYTLSVAVWGASLLGAALVGVGARTLGGKARGQKWGTLVSVCGIAFCAVGFAFHWGLLMPAVNASQSSVIRRAPEDLNVVIPTALAAGLTSMIVAALVPLGGRRQIGMTGSLSAPV
jgi:hypothetical protein